jgi:hypothetical protein
MPAHEPAQAQGTDLEQAVERQIVRRTGGRIRRLRVELREGRVIVHGYTSSYHSKQLALAAVGEVLNSTPVELGIEVIKSERAAQSAGPP